MSKVSQSTVAEAVDRYVAAWNGRNADRRRALIADTWTEGGYYVDPHRRVVDAHNDRVRFTWEAGGTKDAPVHFVGTDFGILAEDGRFESITGFVDVGPGAPSKQ